MIFHMPAVVCHTIWVASLKEERTRCKRAPGVLRKTRIFMVLTKKEVTSIDPENKTVTFVELETKDVHTIDYDYLL
jgi:NADH dehydrogenase FAD-containing subunit